MSEKDDKEWEAMTEDAYEHGDLKDRLKTAEARIERMDSLVHKLSADMDFCSADNEILGQQIKRLERAVTTLYAVADMMKLRNMWSPFWTELEKELLELTQDVMKEIPEHKGGLR